MFVQSLLPPDPQIPTVMWFSGQTKGSPQVPDKVMQWGSNSGMVVVGVVD